MSGKVDILGKTIEIGDYVFTTTSSDTFKFTIFGKVTSFVEDEPAVFITLENVPIKDTYRLLTQVLCLTQQQEYNLTNYPENLI
jgi:hypothetical protein